ncbi:MULTISPECIES: DoxX family protein [Streptosporangium]|uniref:Membrane protein YphA (DoxX/SURF4 family) n=1 Tax=Streptosporangium brasiliense TaxID=47480 RepID=A0ABT9R1V7_9ACTN|nr:DoxX family protein [Streptosporangium brasiliense]MDP9863183.1 putative membrane protein YphA (DoxX/SURF4 family) [Streptosporangium brasiliense]
MDLHVSENLLGAKDIEQQPKGRGTRFTLNGALWPLQVLFGFFFAGSGFGKVLLYDGALYAAAPRAVAWYAAVPQSLIVFIGICEVLGGIGLILPAMTGVKPKLTPLAAAGLALTMILAAGFHIMRGEYGLVPANLLLGGVAAFIAVGRWKLRPIAPTVITTSRALKSFAALGALALLVFAPTWYTMTNVQF